MSEILQNLRKERNLTHKEMAKLLNLKTASAYCKKELGYVPFSLQEAKIIADFFGKKIEDIFFTDELSQ